MGYLWAEDPKVHKLADWRIDSLTELPALIEAARAWPLGRQLNMRSVFAACT